MLLPRYTLPPTITLAIPPIGVVGVGQFNYGIYQGIAGSIFHRAGSQFFDKIGGIKAVGAFFYIPAIVAAFVHNVYLFAQITDPASPTYNLWSPPISNEKR